MTNENAEPRTQAFVDGRFVDAADGATFADINPADGSTVADVVACGEADVDAAVRSARAAFDSGVWSELAPAERKVVLLRFADLVEEHLAELAAMDSRDAGKPITDCEELDLPDAIATLRWYAEAVDKVFGKISPTGQEHLGLIVRAPVGVVAAVLPWNFPMATLAWKLGPALAAGNSVIVKPAELAPLSTIRIAELAFEAGVPAGVLNVVPGLGHVTGKALGLHPDVDAVTFTGSTEVGRQFLRYSADSNLKMVALECGGKSPQIVLEGADDLPAIAADLAGAAFWNAGQNCTCGSRILVHESLVDEFVELLAREANQLKLGDPADRSTTLGAIVEESALRRIVDYVEGARSAGAQIVTGGEVALTESGGWYYPATVVAGVTPEMAVAREEIFGPVVSVLTFSTEDQAVDIANDSPYGLAATVFSRDMDAAFRVARAVEAGTVAVNAYSEGDVTTPFGGFKTSGFGGHDKGIEAFDQYTELKTIWVTLR